MKKEISMISAFEQGMKEDRKASLYHQLTPQINQISKDNIFATCPRVSTATYQSILKSNGGGDPTKKPFRIKQQGATALPRQPELEEAGQSNLGIEMEVSGTQKKIGP